MIRSTLAVAEAVARRSLRHAFTNPNADKAGLPPLKYDAKADRRHWIALTSFLSETFA